MNPALANRSGLGASFKGLGLYLLHDKRPDEHDGMSGNDITADAQTAHRVGFTETRNLATDNGDRAWKLMIMTASRADELKQMAGIKATGRKLEKPVLHYSLNWHPDETPTREQMVAAVEFSLKALGLEEHEALIVQHTEMAHSHVHIMVNRVHPETGVAAKLSNSRLALDKWADQYERANEHIVSPNRAEKYDAIARGEKASAKRQWLPHDEWMQKKAAAKARNEAWRHFKTENDALWQKQHQDGRAFKAAAYNEARRDAAAARLATRGEFKDDWRKLYASQNADKRDLEAITGDSDAIRFINTRADLLRLGIERQVCDAAARSGSELTIAGFRREVDDRLVQMKTSRRTGALKEIVEAAHTDQTEVLAHNVRIAQDKASAPHWARYGESLRDFYASQNADRNALRSAHGFALMPEREGKPRPDKSIEGEREVQAVRAMPTQSFPKVRGPAFGLNPPDMQQRAEALRRKWRQRDDKGDSGRERDRFPGDEPD